MNNPANQIENTEAVRGSGERPWTPGPWTAFDRGVGWEVNDANEESINQGYRDTFTEADARLVAAAPDLFEALEAMLNRFVHFSIGKPERDAARVAIAKALGRE